MPGTNDYPLFQAFPRTSPPPDFLPEILDVFSRVRATIDTHELEKGLKSDDVLAILRPDLVRLGFEVEASKSAKEKIARPVFFGPLGVPTLRYEIDAYSSKYRCGLEVEAGRAWMGNAVYRDLIQAMVMTDVDYLLLAVPMSYKYKSNERSTESKDFQNTCMVAEALFGHSRLTMPYRLVVIGY